jgi:methionyl-tRNA synthetase
MKQTAQKEGLTPRALADRNSARFRDMAAALNLSNDDFIRTTEPRHYRASEEIWQRMEAAGDIFLKKYAGWYSVRDEAFYNETETTVGKDGVCVGPQGTPVEWTEEETFFFRLSKYEKALLEHYDKNPDFILPPERRNEVVSFVKGGLEDLSISRTTLDWGIPVPAMSSVGSHNGPPHVMYVWVDALTNYITGVGFPDEKSSRWHYWPADVHVIGKDIVRFHAVYWPAFLMSAGLPLPKRIYSHGFVLNRGEKMSKSVGNVVDPFDLVRTYGVDQVRYFFLREVMFGQDGNYSTDAIANRINADLANDLGNLAQRSLSMIAKNCAEKVPEPGDFTDADKTMLAATDALYAKARDAMDRQAITRYLDAVWAVVADANRYFAAEEPWAKKKTDPKRMETILYVTAEVVRQVAILAAPVMPASAAKLLDLLSQDAGARSFAALGEKGRLAPGTAVPVPQGVFPRYVDPEEAAKAPPAPAPKPKKGGDKQAKN